MVTELYWALVSGSEDIKGGYLGNKTEIVLVPYQIIILAL